MVVKYRVEIDGNDITDKLRAEGRLISITVTDRMGEHADSVGLELDDRPPHVAWPPQGAALRLWAGEATLYDLGTFALDAPQVSAPPHRLSVTGHSASFIASNIGSSPTNHMRWQVWENITVSDLANTIAQEHGLTVKVSTKAKTRTGDVVETTDPIAGVNIGTREQNGESDLAFLSRVLEDYNAACRVKRGQLEVFYKGKLLINQVTITPQEVEGYDATLQARRNFGSVVARWVNPKSGASGEKKAGTAKPTLVLTELFESATQAASAAKGQLKTGERESAILNLRMSSLRLDLPAGVEVGLSSGFRSEIAGSWVVTEAHHRIADRPRTQLVCERKLED